MGVAGCYDEETGGWSAVCKIMSGFTDAFYRDLYARFAPDSESTSTTCFPGVDAEGASSLTRASASAYSLFFARTQARHLVQAERGLGDQRSRVSPFTSSLSAARLIASSASPSLQSILQLAAS